jgi:molybdopterin-guanine dinucleotide biosynthesis protein B
LYTEMSRPRAVAVVGYKDSGKTQVIEALVGELTGRGYRVGTLKHTVEETLLDTPGKDTWRHRQAGARASAIIHEKGAALFIDRNLTVNEAVAELGELDFVVLEGFKYLKNVARIITPRNEGEIEGLSNGLEIAVADTQGTGPSIRSQVPVIPLSRPGELADLVELKAFSLLPGLNCGGCGYDECEGLARAILSGEADAGKCVGLDFGDLCLRVDGETVPLGPFVKEVTRNVVLGLVRSFKGVGEPSRVELALEVGKGDG